MGVGCGRILGRVQRVSLDMWCMWCERVFILDFGMILGASIFPFKDFFHVLGLRKHGSLS